MSANVAFDHERMLLLLLWSFCTYVFACRVTLATRFVNEDCRCAQFKEDFYIMMELKCLVA